MNEITFLTIGDVIDIHDSLIEEYGGASGLRDRGLLESAIAQAKLHKQFIVNSDLFHIAAIYAFHIIKNHAFVDGNKRTGTLAALAFLVKNRVLVVANSDALYELAIKIACSEINKEEIAEFFVLHRVLLR
jgi:death on curing protein